MCRYTDVRVNAEAERRLASGEITVHIRDIQSHPECAPGDGVRVFSPDNRYLGTGYINLQSKIAIRILTRADIPLNDTFWNNAIHNALNFRLRFFAEEESFRLIFGEADGMPGLVVDKFGDILCVQSATAGIDRNLPRILAALEDVCHPAGIFLSFDSRSRFKEGLPLFRKVHSGILDGPFPAPIDGIPHLIDPVGGHKTGFFLDHRVNRRKAAGLCSDRRVLDAFCYTGAFAVRAALSGARTVDAVDIFDPGLGVGVDTAELNGVADVCRFNREEVFQFLQSNMDTARWDLIFLDPPAFVRGGQRAKRNMANYRKINRYAMRCLAPNGILISSSCSFHVGRSEFISVLGRAMQEAGRRGRIFDFQGAGPDHPILPGMPETDYLKCAFIQMDD